jgi:hypothetical protein
MQEALLQPLRRHAAPFDEFLAALFQAFERAGIRTCVLRNYEGFPFENVGGDIDFLISPSELPRAVRALQSIDNMRIVGFTEPSYAVRCAFLEGVSLGPQTRAIQVDFYFRLAWKGMPYLDVETVLQSTESHLAGSLSFLVPSPVHEAIISLFSSLLVSRYLKEKYFPKVQRTFAAKKSEVISALTPQFALKPATQMVDAVIEGDRQRIMACRMPLCWSLARRNLLRAPFRSAMWVARHFRQALVFRLTPRNIETVYILDSDGDCSAIIIERLLPILTSVAKNAEEFILLPPRKTPSSHRESGVIAPSRMNAQVDASISLIKIAQSVAMDWVEQFNVKDDLKLRLCGISYRDLPIRSGTREATIPMWFARFVAKLASPADLWIYLEPGVDAMQSNNPDLKPGEAARRLDVYRSFLKSVRGRRVVLNASKSLTDITEEAYAVIVDTLAARTQRFLKSRFP